MKREWKQKQPIDLGFTPRPKLRLSEALKYWASQLNDGSKPPTRPTLIKWIQKKKIAGIKLARIGWLVDEARFKSFVRDRLADSSKAA